MLSVFGRYGLMSKIGVLSTKSAPETKTKGAPSPVKTISSILTRESPKPFGLKGERLAKTPTFWLPPNLGGRTSGENAFCFVREKSKISQR